MMNKYLLLLFIVLPALTFAQKMKVLSGDFKFLKDQKELNLRFEYDGMTFYNEKKTETTYVKERMADISKNKGQAEAESWKKDWDHSKSTSFVNKFVDSFNKNGKMIMAQQSNAKYTLIVKTEWIYPGWFGGVMAQASKVSTKLRFVETTNSSKVLLEVNSEKAPGNVQFVGVPNTNDRIAEGYAKTAKSLAGMLNKKVK